MKGYKVILQCIYELGDSPSLSSLSDTLFCAVHRLFLSLCLVIALIYICALFSYLTVYITCETASWLSLFFIEQNQIYNSIHYWAETQSLKDELEQQLLLTFLHSRELIFCDFVVRSLNWLLPYTNYGGTVSWTPKISFIRTSSLVMGGAAQPVKRVVNGLLWF